MASRRGLVLADAMTCHREGYIRLIRVRVMVRVRVRVRVRARVTVTIMVTTRVIRL